MALYYEDLTEGQTFTSPARTVTETDLVSGFSGPPGMQSATSGQLELCSQPQPQSFMNAMVFAGQP